MALLGGNVRIAISQYRFALFIAVLVAALLWMLPHAGASQEHSEVDTSSEHVQALGAQVPRSTAAGDAGVLRPSGTTVPFPTTGESWRAQVWNGTPAVRGQFRHVAIIDFPGREMVGGCSATLIRARWLLTAAHCVNEVPAQRLVIGLGGTTIGRVFDEVFRTRVHAVHPQYSPRSKVYDFALIKLPRRSHIPSVPLATYEDQSVWQPDTPATIAGWGGTDSRGSGLGILRYGMTQLAWDGDCELEYEDYNIKSMLCASALESDTCQGDSGGPLFVSTVNGDLQMGVTSFGFPCETSLFGVYGFVPAATEWIDTVTANGIPRMPTAIRLRARTERVRHEVRLHLRGRLVRRGEGVPLAYQKLRLLGQRADGGRWRVLASAVSNSNGRVRFRSLDDRHMRYRLQHVESTATEGSLSAVASAGVWP